MSIINRQSLIGKVYSRYLHSPGSHQSTRFLELLSDSVTHVGSIASHDANKHRLKAPGCPLGRAEWWRFHQTGWASSCSTGNPSSWTHALPGCLCLCSNHRQENRGCDILISPKGGGEDVKLRKEPVHCWDSCHVFFGEQILSQLLFPPVFDFSQGSVNSCVLVLISEEMCFFLTQIYYFQNNLLV